MLKSKLFSLFTFIVIIIFSNHIELQEKDIIPSKNEIKKEGGKAILAEQEIYVNFFGYNDMPNEKTIWKKTIENNFEILEYINSDQTKFIQKWCLKNPIQPTLEIMVSKPNTKINLRHELIITTKKPTKECQILTNFKRIKNKYNKLPTTISISGENGWISVNNNYNIFAMKINNDKFEIKKNKIKIYKENLNTEIIKEKYQFHSSKALYSTLKNQKEFNELEENIDFGYYLYRISKASYIICKKIEELSKNKIIAILFLILLIGLLFSPFTIDSIEMQRIFESMQPELEGINKLCHLTFTQKQIMIKEVHNRYGYSQIQHFLGQILLIIGLTIFQSVFSTIEFVTIVPNMLLINGITMITLCLTVVLYNMILFKNNQAFISALFSLFFIGYPTLPLIGFILLHWFNIALYCTIFKLKNRE